jgi:hypothetical protein
LNNTAEQLSRYTVNSLLAEKQQLTLSDSAIKAQMLGQLRD